MTDSTEPRKFELGVTSSNDTKLVLGTIEWDDDLERWCIYGEHKNVIQEVLGGMFCGGRRYTLRDRELYKPLTFGYTAFRVKEIKDQEE